MKIVEPVLVALFLIFIFTKVALAVTSVTDVPTTLSDSEELTANVTLSGLGKSTLYYLKGDFVKEGTTNYFGQTWNGSAWVKTGSDKTNYLAVTTDEAGQWSGSVKAKPDLSDSGFSGSGVYLFKIGRYTVNSTSPDWSGPFNVQINSTSVPTATPTGTTASATPSPSVGTEEGDNQKQFTIGVGKADFGQDESISVSFEITGLTASTNYFLKCAFSKEGSSNYFGYTGVGESLVKNSDNYAKQMSITISGEGSFKGSLTCKPDAADTGFAASGSYNLKIGRYSASGSGPTWSNSVVVNLQKGTVTSTTTTAPTIKSTSSSGEVVAAKTETGKSTSKATQKSKTAGSTKPSEEVKVLGVSTDQLYSTGSGQVDLNIKNGGSQKLDVRVLLTGLILIGFSGFLAYRKFRFQKPTESIEPK